MTMDNRRTPHSVSNRILFEALYKRHNDDGCTCHDCRQARHQILTDLARQIKVDECPEKASKWLEAHPKKRPSTKSEYFLGVDLASGPDRTTYVKWHPPHMVPMSEAEKNQIRKQTADIADDLADAVWMSEAGYMSLEQVDQIRHHFEQAQAEQQPKEPETFDITTQFPKWFE